jgi:alcohol dehydrogenase class IV
VALALGVDPRRTAGDTELAVAGAGRFETLLRSVGLPVSLSGDGLGEADVARLVTVTMAPENRPMVDSNAVQPSDEDLVALARAILTAV